MSRVLDQKYEKVHFIVVSHTYWIFPSTSVNPHIQREIPAYNMLIYV